MTDFDQRNQTVGTQYNAESINIGVPFEQYKADLAEKEKEIRELLVNVALSEKEKSDLNIQLAEVERQRLDEQASYEAHVKDLEERIGRLDRLSGQVPDKLTKEAKQALLKGDNAQAEHLFQRVKAQGNAQIKAVAEVEFQLAKIAQDGLRYREAYQQYQRAVQLNPDDTLYLNDAGLMADTLGEYNKAIEYYEQALASDLNTYGEGHPKVAIDRNNLGSAYQALGQVDKAIGYYKQALASDLNTYGEGHPEVAIRRNNLGGAYDALGQYNKAIEYYEQALASDLITYGEEHPEVAYDATTWVGHIGL